MIFIFVISYFALEIYLWSKVITEGRKSHLIMFSIMLIIHIFVTLVLIQIYISR